MTTACAPGKIILLGEHAVVYGRPALAVPVRQVRACARIEPAPGGRTSDILLVSTGAGPALWMSQAPADHPLATAARTAIDALRPGDFPAVRLVIDSTIPVASGLGSSAAVSVAIVRALAAHFAQPLPDPVVSDLAYAVEKIHHGTPSGIDNTVVTYDRPVYFRRGAPPEALPVGGRLRFVIGDTGIPAPTSVAVGDVRRAWQADPSALERTFDAIAEAVEAGRRAVVAGDADGLGHMLDANHELLHALGVSSPELDRLVRAARSAGALGAKLSGGGRGGNMIALAAVGGEPPIAAALRAAGAAAVLTTELAP